MKYWKVDCGYQSIPAMGDWHSCIRYVMADNFEEACTKAFKGILGFNFSGSVDEITKEEYDNAPEYRKSEK